MHITGLPYEASFYNTQTFPNNWAYSGEYTWRGYDLNAADGGKYLRMKGADEGSRALLKSPQFRIPATTNVQTTTDFYPYSSSAGEKFSICVKPSNSNPDRNMPKEYSKEETITLGWDKFAEYNDLICNMQLDTSISYVAITHNMTKPKKFLGIGPTRFIGLKYIKINYR